MSMNFLGQQRLAALGAHDDGIKYLPALAVLMQHGTPAFVDHVGIAPMHQRHYDRIEIETLLGQDVFVPLRRFLVRNAP